MATSYHAGKFLRPHSPSGKVFSPQDGTVYFTPDPSLYRTLAPQRARMADDYDAVRELGQSAPDLRLTAWTVGLHNSRLGQAHPELTTETVFGDWLINSLCPAQPEVRHYLAALCVDTANQPGVPEIAVETPGWQAFRHGHLHEFELVALPDRVQVMLGMCYCDACCSGAAAFGLNLSVLAADTRRQLELFFSDGKLPETAPETDPDWVAFRNWRASVVTGLVAEIRIALPRDVGLAVIPTTQSPNALCWVEGSELAELSRVADRLEIPAYQIGATAVAEDAAYARNTAGDGAEIGFILRPSYLNCANADEVAQAVSALRAQAPSSLSFYNYGHMRLSALDWIAAAPA